jgi:hypothetical protein
MTKKWGVLINWKKAALLQELTFMALGDGDSTNEVVQVRKNHPEQQATAFMKKMLLGSSK